MLEGIRLDILLRQSLVRHHIVRELNDLDVQPTLGGNLAHDIEHLGMRPGGDTDPDGFGLGRADQRGKSKDRRRKRAHGKQLPIMIHERCERLSRRRAMVSPMVCTL